MHKLKYLSLTVLLGISISTMALAGDIYVISNANVHLTADDIREVFLGEKQFDGSVKIVPVDNGSAQEAFLSKVIKMDATKYNTNWTKKSFRDGLSPPVSKASDADVSSFVKSTPGAVGYVTTKPDIPVIQKY